MSLKDNIRLAIENYWQYKEYLSTTNGSATNIYRLIDSQNMTTFLTKGSAKKHIQEEVFRIMVLCQRLNFIIIPIPNHYATILALRLQTTVQRQPIQFFGKKTWKLTRK